MTVDSSIQMRVKWVDFGPRFWWFWAQRVEEMKCNSAFPSQTPQLLSLLTFSSLPVAAVWWEDSNLCDFFECSEFGDTAFNYLQISTIFIISSGLISEDKWKHLRGCFHLLLFTHSLPVLLHRHHHHHHHHHRGQFDSAASELNMDELW